MAQPNAPVRVEKAYNEDKEREIPRNWWALDEKDVFESVWSNVGRIVLDQNIQSNRNLFYASLYEGRELSGFGAGSFNNPFGMRSGTGPSWNIVRAVTDTVTSKIGSEKPKPLALTDDEDWGKQQRAEKLSAYLEGSFDRMKVWPKGRMSFRDSCNLGTGVLKFHNTTGKVMCDRVLCEEIVVDRFEAMYGEPRTLYQKRWVSKDVVAAIWPDHEGMIYKAVGRDVAGGEGAILNSYSDMILVIEAWHLRSSESAKDGAHAIIIENGTLELNERKHDWFPFVFKRYSPRMLGFFGMGLAEELAGTQLEINKMLRTIAIAQHLVSVPQVWLDIASKIPESQMSNEIAGTHYYSGKTPVFMNPQAMNPEIYNYLETLWGRGFECAGVSQMSSGGLKPAGVDSGVAMRTLQDVESDRFKTTQQQDQESYIEAAYIVVALEKELADKGETKPSVQVTNNKSTKTLRWDEVEMDLKDFSIRLWPTNLLPSDPAGKLSFTTDMMKAGFFSEDESLSLLDYPDVNAISRLKTAPRDAAMRIIGNILTKGEYETPEPQMNLDLTKQLAQMSYLKARNDNAPADRLDLLLSFMEDIEAMLDEQKEIEQAAMAAEMPPPEQLPPGGPPMLPPGAEDPMMMEGMPPIGQPEAQPVSDLLPVA